MGYLTSFDLRSFGCDVLVETGTGLGTSLIAAASAGCFDRLYSCDVDRPLVYAARIKVPQARIGTGLSTVCLARWLAEDLRAEDRVLFFLDAHFPGADFRGQPYTFDIDHAVPLREELELIRRHRPSARDVIICDDARVYVEGQYAHGPSPFGLVPGGMDFVYDLFPRDHVSIDYRDEGYIVIDLR